MFSIIIPVYNVESYIKDTVKSITESDFDDFEIILVNDGSKDKSGEICRSLSDRDIRIKYIEKENGGVASARNMGLSYAEGEYLLFLDSDDMYKPGTLKRVNDVIAETGCDICQFGYQLFSDFTEETYPIASMDMYIDKEKTTQMAVKILTSNYIKPNFTGYSNGEIGLTITSAAVKREIIKNNNIEFFSFWNNEDDWIFAVLCYKYAKDAYLISDCYYRYRKTNNSLSRTKRYIEDLYVKRCKSITWIENLLDSLCVSSDEKKDEYKGILQRKLLLYVLYNESVATNDVSIRESIGHIREAVKSEKRQGFHKNILCNASKIEKLYFMLLTHNCEAIAYVINRCLIKKYR